MIKHTVQRPTSVFITLIIPEGFLLLFKDVALGITVGRQGNWTVLGPGKAKRLGMVEALQRVRLTPSERSHDDLGGGSGHSG